MRILALLVALVVLALAGAANLHDDSPNQYTIEDSLASPDGRFVATRFQEATPFVTCSEVVVVMPSTVQFSTGMIKEYVPYTVFADDCSVEVRARWTENSTLAISSTMNRSEELASKNWKKSPLGSVVTINFHRMKSSQPREAQ
jgi:hypothetical protein